MRDEPDFMRDLLVESWRGKAVQQVFEGLGSSDGGEPATLREQQSLLMAWELYLASGRLEAELAQRLSTPQPNTAPQSRATTRNSTPRSTTSRR